MDQPNGAQNDNQFNPDPAQLNEQESITPVQNNNAMDSQPANEPSFGQSTEVPAAPSVDNSSAPSATPDFASQESVTPVAPAFAPFSQQSPVLPGAQPAKKPKKKWLALAVAGGALLLLGGGASAYYFGVYQSPENVLHNAYKNMVSATNLQVSGNVNFEMDSIFGIKLKSIAYESKADNAPGAELDLKAKLVVMSSDIEVGGKGMFTDNGDLYFQLNGIKDAMQTLMKTAGSTTVPAEYLTALEKVQDQWVKVTNADIKKQSEEQAKAYQCWVDVTKKHKDSDNKEMIEAFKKNTFIEKKEDLGYKDGYVGYKINFDEAKFKAFGKDVENTPYVKELKDCTKALEGDKTPAPITSDSTDQPKVDSNYTVSVWVDQWNHHLKKVEYSGSGKTGEYKLNATGVVNVGYDKSVKVKAPTDTITLEEFNKRFEDLSNKLNIPTGSLDQSAADDYSTDL